MSEEARRDEAELEGPDTVSDAGAGGGKLGLRPTRRDEQIMGLLAIARYLTTGQVARTLFSGRLVKGARMRLDVLAGMGPTHQIDRPLLQRGKFRNGDGYMEYHWSLTGAGYMRAARFLHDPAFEREPVVPKNIIVHGAEYIEHIILTNEILVGAIAPPPEHAPNLHGHEVSWVGPDRLRLSYSLVSPKTNQWERHLLIPDAAIELQKEKRRIFIEYETGSQPLVAPGREGSAKSKLDAYHAYTLGFADAKARVSFYRNRFRDGFAPEVLFVTPNVPRFRSLSKVVNAWVAANRPANFSVKVFTLDHAIEELKRKVPAPVPIPRGNRVAPGRAVPTVEELRSLQRCLEDCFGVFRNVRAALKCGEPVKPPSVPASWAIAEEVLVRHGLREGRKA